jgi:hypothetical protein
MRRREGGMRGTRRDEEGRGWMRRDEETRRRGGTRRDKEGRHTVKVTTSKIGGSLLMSLKGRRHLLNEHQKKGQQRLKKALVKNSKF